MISWGYVQILGTQAYMEFGIFWGVLESIPQGYPGMIVFLTCNFIFYEKVFALYQYFILIFRKQCLWLLSSGLIFYVKYYILLCIQKGRLKIFSES